MKLISKGLWGAFLFMGSLPFFFSGSPVLIESEESFTQQGKPVFNEIRLISIETKDIWMMNQSHYGIDAPAEKWDRVAIVVDKSVTPKRARFLQLVPGPLEWSEGIPRVPFRVSCFRCHSNGPRAIRPVDSADGAKVLLWNLRIKSYGRVVYDSIHEEEDKTMKPPFRSRFPIDTDRLEVASCTRCHQETGFIARGPLERQNSIAIRHMLNTKHMPPLGFSLTAEDKIRIDEFLLGF